MITPLQQHLRIGAVGLLWLASALAHAQAAGDTLKEADDSLIARGRYVVTVSGCNDCHTPGYGMAEGQVPEALWLTGDKLGWHGPWGTTYATNLRLLIAQLSETQWVEMTRALKARPPMPWFNLNHMSSEDATAVYHYIRFLGPAGEPSPAYLPPGVQPAQPYVSFPTAGL